MKGKTYFDIFNDIAYEYVKKEKYRKSLISLPLLRKENDKIYVGYYIFTNTDIYAEKPYCWLLIDIDKEKVVKCYKTKEYDFDSKKLLPEKMKILLKPDNYLQLVFQDFTYAKMLYQKENKYDFNKMFTKEYLEIDRLKILSQNEKNIKYTDYFKNNISNYNSDETEKFVISIGKIISKQLITEFNNVLGKIKKKEDYQTDLKKYLDLVKFALIQDIQLINAFDNVSENEDAKLNKALEIIANRIIPNRRQEKMNELVSKIL